MNEFGVVTYFYKSLDELSYFLKLKPTDYIFTCHASDDARRAFPNCHIVENLSDLLLYKDAEKSEEALVESIIHSDSFWSFDPIENIDVLHKLNKNVLFNSNKLFGFFDNKLLHNQHFKQQSKILRNNIYAKEELLDTQYSIGSQVGNLIISLSYDCVISEQYSSGGSGVQLFSRHKINAPLNIRPSSVYRIEKFHHQLLSINQAGILFKDGVVIFSLTEQIIKLFGNNLKYSGSKILHLKQKEIESKVCKLTNEVSRILKKSGYLGAFGCDYFIINNEVYLSEVNPRYQGSLLFFEKLYKKISPFLLNYKAHTGGKLKELIPEYKKTKKPVFLKIDSDAIYERHYSTIHKESVIESDGYSFEYLEFSTDPYIK